MRREGISKSHHLSVQVFKTWAMPLCCTPPNFLNLCDLIVAYYYPSIEVVCIVCIVLFSLTSFSCNSPYPGGRAFGSCCKNLPSNHGALHQSFRLQRTQKRSHNPVSLFLDQLKTTCFHSPYTWGPFKNLQYFDLGFGNLAGLVFSLRCFTWYSFGEPHLTIFFMSGMRESDSLFHLGRMSLCQLTNPACVGSGHTYLEISCSCDIGLDSLLEIHF